MEQDDKVFTAAHSIGSTLGFGPTSVRTVRAGGSVETAGVDANASVAHDAHTLEEVVGSASAMDTETPHGSGLEEPQGASDTPTSELTDDVGDSVPPSKASEAKSGSVKSPKKTNNVRKIRIERMMSKAELARRANLSVLTIDRVERGYGCRVDTKRKILEALGLSLADRVRVFGEEE